MALPPQGTGSAPLASLRAPRHRPGRPARIMLGTLAALVIIVGAGEILEWPFLRAPLAHELTRVLGRPVQLGQPFGVRLIGSVRGHADTLVIGPGGPGSPTLVDDVGQPRDFMRARHIQLALSYGALWRQYRSGGSQALQVRLLDVDGLELNLKRNADGQANWQFGAAQPASPASAPQLPQFERLNVRNGEVRLDDIPLQITADAHVSTHEGTALPLPTAESAGAAPQLRIAQASGASAALPVQAPRSPAPPAASGAPRVRSASALTSAAAVTTSDSGAAGAPALVDDNTPGLHVDGTGSYHKAPLVLQLRSSGLLPLAASDAEAPAVPLWLDVHAGKTRIRLDGVATDLLHFGGMDATFKASGPSLAAVGDALGVTLPTTAQFDTHGRLRKQGLVWNAEVAAMSIGSSRLRGAFRYDAAPATPLLSGTLQGQRLALVDLGPAFGAATPDTPTVKSTDRVLPEREFDIPSLKAMNADIAVALDTVDLGTDKLEPFRPLQGRIELKDGMLDLRDLVARTSAGVVQGLIALDSRPALPLWRADLRWNGIQLERFIKTRDIAARKNADGARADTGYISGALGGNAQLTGQGRSTAKLLGSLDGSARLWVRDGQISHLLIEATGIDVAQALGVYIKGDDKMPMQCAVAQLLVVNGKVMPEVGVIDTRDTTLLIGGELSLADESLALHMTAHPHDFSPLALRSPVKVEGHFSDPHVRLEAKPLILRAGAAAALSLASPLAALLALVDFKQAEKDVCTTAVSHVVGAAQAGVKSGPATPAPAVARAPAAPASHALPHARSH